MAVPMKQIVFKVTDDEHKAIKAVALENNRTMNRQMLCFAMADTDVQKRLKKLMRERASAANPYKNQNV